MLASISGSDTMRLAPEGNAVRFAADRPPADTGILASMRRLFTILFIIRRATKSPAGPTT